MRCVSRHAIAMGGGGLTGKFNLSELIDFIFQ